MSQDSCGGDCDEACGTTAQSLARSNTLSHPRLWFVVHSAPSPSPLPNSGQSLGWCLQWGAGWGAEEETQAGARTSSATRKEPGNPGPASLRSLASSWARGHSPEAVWSQPPPGLAGHLV